MLQIADPNLGRYPISTVLSAGYEGNPPHPNAQVQVTNGKVTRNATVQQVLDQEVYIRLR